MQSANELIAEKFAQIKDEITADDRKEAIATLELSHVTIVNYIAGNGPNPDLGIKIYEFFHGRIQDRLARIKEIA